ncbi:hypothetical protein H5186_03385 [Pseudoalteromonas sp. SG41-2]|uniref:hypothetical protein n=1 Tax=Pseudoalteromonas sp. SG41-2 TaxID=2760978 RepID=UPI0016020510|nr:hypothetical protein [Pseudoalteromonas sp. SG41-2]MBB1478507.1 hypothetical protein [Pseudoalteromonas sp. SG41-2]
MTDSVKIILRDKLRKVLLPDFTNKLTWLFGFAGIALIGGPAALKFVGKISTDYFGFPIDLNFESEDNTIYGIVLCGFALIQNITYQIYNIIVESNKSNSEIDHVTKEKEILEKENKYLETVSAVNVIAQINAMKELHEIEVNDLKIQLQKINTTGSNDQVLHFEREIQNKEQEISNLLSTIKMMSDQTSVSVGNKFVIGVSPFEYQGKQFIFGVINNIHMHFPLEHILSALDGVSSNPNAPLSKYPEKDKFVLTLNNEGSFKMTISEGELNDLISKIRGVKTA